MKLSPLAVLAAGALAISVSATDAGAADKRDFWVLNQTGRTIREIHLAVHGDAASPWGDDILTDGNLANGGGAARCEIA